MALDSPHKIYKEVAEKLVAKLLDNLTKTTKKDESPDLHWKMEKAILEALKWAHRQGDAQAKEKYLSILKDFDSRNGTPNN